MKVAVYIKEPKKIPRQCTMQMDETNIRRVLGGHYESWQICSDMVILHRPRTHYQEEQEKCCEIGGQPFYGTIIFVGKLIGYMDVQMGWEEFKFSFGNLFEEADNADE